MTLLTQILVVGVILGAVYALAGAGLVVLYRTTGMINFAHGDVATAALFVALALMHVGVPFPVAAVATVVVSSLLDVMIGLLLTSRFFRDRGVADLVIATIAASLIFQGIESMTLGQTARPFPSLGAATLFRLASVAITVSDMVTLAMCLAAFTGLMLFFRYSSWGIAMRAISEDADTARLLGVPGMRLRLASWASSGALAGLAGLAIAPIYSLQPTSIDVLVIYGFAVIVAGGFESLAGALVFGVAVGVLQNLVQAYVSTSLVLFSLYLFMLVVLAFRPQGLFGRRLMERV